MTYEALAKPLKAFQMWNLRVPLTSISELPKHILAALATDANRLCGMTSHFILCGGDGVSEDVKASHELNNWSRI